MSTGCASIQQTECIYIYRGVILGAHFAKCLVALFEIPFVQYDVSLCSPVHVSLFNQCIRYCFASFAVGLFNRVLDVCLLYLIQMSLYHHQRYIRLICHLPYLDIGLLDHLCGLKCKSGVHLLQKLAIFMGISTTLCQKIVSVMWISNASWLQHPATYPKVFLSLEAVLILAVIRLVSLSN